MQEWLSVFLKGFAMGAANVVPGVSGGTIAFITGIYERLINALKSFDVKAIRLMFSGQIKAFIAHVDFWFLLSLGLGGVASVLTLAKLLEIGFTEYPVYVAALFFGLILASIYSVGRLVGQWAAAQYIALGAGLLVAVSMAFLPAASESHNVVYLMLCGVVAMCSMIIPGVSGSFVLLLMGNYQLIMIHSVNNLREGDMASALPVLIPVGIGAVLGLIVLSRLLSWLFKRYHDTAVAVITGFVAGSLVIIWPWKIPGEVVMKNGEEKVLSYIHQLPSLNAEFYVALTIIIAGVALLLLVEKLGAKKED